MLCDIEDKSYEMEKVFVLSNQFNNMSMAYRDTATTIDASKHATVMVVFQIQIHTVFV